MPARRCRFFIDDALDKLKKISSNSVDHCITDPPYNISGYDGKKPIGWLKTNSLWTKDKKFNKIDEKWDSFSDEEYIEFTKKWLDEVFRVVKPNGNVIIFGTFHNIYTLGYLMRKYKKKIIGSITWYKRNAFPNITRRMLCESTEYLIWGVNNSVKDAKCWTFNYDVLKEINNGKQMRNVWDIPMTSKSEKQYGKHPSQKPIEVCKRLIIGMTNENDVVLDPFAGSGTIPLVAKMNNRKYIAIEKDKKYAKIAQKRLKNIMTSV